MKYKFLIFKIKSVCYDSTFYLAELYGRTLAKMGHEVEYFSTDQEPITNLERYEGVHFDAMLDFNSLLPNLDTDEGDLFLDRIDAPFYDYILDHPLYHNKQLKAGLKRFHVICLDDEHGDYIRRYYPHIRSVSVLPLCGLPFLKGGEGYQVSKLYRKGPIEQLNFTPQSLQEIPKCNDLVFTGTFSDSNIIYKKICSFDKPFSDEMKQLCEILLEKPSMNFEEAMLALAGQSDSVDSIGEIPADKMNIPDRLYAFFMVDMFVKSYFREQVLEAVLKTGRKLAVYGGMWDLWETSYASQLEIHELVPFKDSPRVLASARLAINVMPWFKSGIHDRVLTAMRSKTVSFTDTSKMLNRYFTDGRELLTYELEHLNLIPEKVEKYLSDNAALEQISCQGQEAVEAGHTEYARCKELCEILGADDDR